MLHSILITLRLMAQSKASKRPRTTVSSVYAEIVGWGKCIPTATLSNTDLASFLDTSDSWIFQRTGTRERPIAHVPVSDLAYVAARRAIATAGTLPEQGEQSVL